jgi:hypothetical protein
MRFIQSNTRSAAVETHRCGLTLKESLMRFSVVAVCCVVLGLPTAQAQEKEGHFQIVVCGWKCVKETIDHALEVDGKGDEVWVTARFQGPNESNSTVVRTKTMGDVNDKPGRVQAGSRSDKGGIKTGDQFPAKPFDKPNSVGKWQADSRPDLPFVIWEGKLVDGKPGVELELSIWEDDEGGAKLWEDVLKVLNAPIVKDQLKSVEVYKSKDGSTAFTIDLSGIGELMQTVFGVAKDRPIGVPKTKSITYSAAKQIASTRRTAEISEGVVAITFKDSEEPKYANQGEYVLWLQVKEIK